MVTSNTKAGRQKQKETDMKNTTVTRWVWSSGCCERTDLIAKASTRLLKDGFEPVNMDNQIESKYIEWNVAQIKLIFTTIELIYLHQVIFSDRVDFADNRVKHIAQIESILSTIESVLEMHTTHF